ncbi:MAG: hypothetical protein JWQ97_2292 [Phenylobacterium sp.]|nr:hypothetical protein [Phenylobacterium sp.]
MHVPLSALTIFASTVLSAVTSYITSRISQQRQQSITSRTYRQALLMEVRALHNRLLEYETAYVQRVITGQISGDQLLKILFQPGETVVFTNNASSIGLFDRRTALRVLRFYSDMRVLEGRAVVLSEAALSADVELVRRERARHLTQLRQVRRRAHFLIRRLHAHRSLPERLIRWGRRGAWPNRSKAGDSVLRGRH